MSFTPVKVGDSTTAQGSALSRDQQIDRAIKELQDFLSSVSAFSGTAVVGDLGVGGNLDTDGTLGADGAVTFDSTLDVVGASTLSGDVAAGGALSVAGDTSLTGKLGVNGVAPAAQAAAITPPAEQGIIYVQADVESLGTAIDAIIVALHNVGITA